MSQAPTLEEWNANCPVGTRVKYRPLHLMGKYEESVTTSIAVADEYGLPSVRVEGQPRLIWLGALEAA